MSDYTMPEGDRRLLELGGGFIAIDQDRVNLDDLLRLGEAARYGAPGIVRCDGDPRQCITVFHGAPPLGVVAGWVSEEG
jgi:hypothetical protein